MLLTLPPAAVRDLPRSVYIPNTGRNNFNGFELANRWTGVGGDPLRWTMSLWVKFHNRDQPGGGPAIPVWSATSPSGTAAGSFYCIKDRNDLMILYQADGNTYRFGEQCNPLNGTGDGGPGGQWATFVWQHWVYSFDSRQADPDDRIKFYYNGQQLADTRWFVAAGVQLPSLNQGSLLFSSNCWMQFGTDNNYQFQNGGGAIEGKIAFVDFVDGAALPASAFAAPINGVWTRQRYPGPFGTLGFQVDGAGSNALNDKSGNNQHCRLIGTASIDSDLPPFTN